MAHIEELHKWCNEARKILGNRGTLKSDAAESAEMKQHSKAVMALLQRMQGFAGLSKQYAESLLAYENIAKRARQASLLGKAAKADRAEELNKAVAALAELSRTLKATTEQHEVDLEHHRTLSTARDAYLLDYTKVKEALELLKVKPKASAVGPERDLARIEEQVKQDSVAGYEVARKSLPAVAQAIKTQTTLAESLRNAELAQWAKKPEAQARFDTAEQAYAELSKLTGIEAILAQYKAVIEEARQLAGQNNWSVMLTALGKLDKLPKAKEAQQESDKQIATLAELPDYVKGKAALAALRTLLPASEVAPMDQAFRDALDAFLTKGPKQLKAVTAASAALSAHLASAKAAAAGLGTLNTELIALKASLAAEVAPMDMVRVQTEFAQFEDLVRAHQQSLARSVGDKLKAYIEAVLPAKVEAHQAWSSGRSEAVRLSDNLESLATSICKTVRERVPSVRSYVDAGRRQTLENDHDWTQLVSDLAKARAGHQELALLHGQYLALEAQRRSAAAQVDGAVTVLELALKQLVATVGSVITDQGKRFDPRVAFDLRITQAKAEWASALAVTADASALQTAMDRTIATLDQISSDIAAVDHPEGVQAMVQLRVQQQAQLDLEQRYPALEKALTALQAKDNTMASRLANRLSVVRSGAALDPVRALADLALLRAEITSASSALDSARTNAQNKVRDLAAAALGEIERARSASSNAKAFKAAFDALTTEHAELVLLGQSTNLDAIQEAQDGLAQLKLRAAKFAPTEPGAGSSIDKVMTALNGAVKVFDALDATLSKNSPKLLLTLKSQLALLKADVSAADPDDAMLKIAAFTKSLTDAETGTKKVIEVRFEYTELLTVVKASFKAFKARDIAPAYTKSLQERLVAIESQAAVPEKLYQALSQLKELGAEVDTAAMQLQAAMGKEEELLRQQHAHAAAKAEWGRAVKVFEDRQIAEARAAVQSKNGDKALILELERMAGAARRSAKDGDPVKAVREIALAAERARQIVADPYGPAIGSRNNLPKDTQVYREAVEAFQAALNDVAGAATKVFPTMPSAVSTKLKNMLDQVAAKFDGNAFEAAIVPLAAEGVDAGQRRAYREAALAKVRSVQSVLTGHPQVLALLNNPLNASKYSGAYRRMQSALARLDANIHRCCS